MSPDRLLLTTLATLRRQWRVRLALEALVWIAVAVVLAVGATLAVLTLFAGNERGPVIARTVARAAADAAHL
jgi:hypothetical protein